MPYVVFDGWDMVLRAWHMVQPLGPSQLVFNVRLPKK